MILSHILREFDAALEHFSIKLAHFLRTVIAFVHCETMQISTLWNVSVVPVSANKSGLSLENPKQSTQSTLMIKKNAYDESVWNAND